MTTVTHQKNETLAANLEPLWFDHWENVSIDVPNESITLAGWVMEHGTDDPWVIAVHGIRSCKANHEALIPALALPGWLQRNLFDMRTMGTAQQKTVCLGWPREHRDVLAVWQWLQDAKGAEPEHIGAVGISMGAGAVTIAFEQEPGLQSVFLESPYSSMGNVIEEEPFLQDSQHFSRMQLLFAGKVSSGDNLVKYEPIEAMNTVGDRAVYVVHSLEDVRINTYHGKAMCEAAQASVSEDGLVGVGLNLQLLLTMTGARRGSLTYYHVLTHPDEYRDRMVGFFEEYRSRVRGLKRKMPTEACSGAHDPSQPDSSSRSRVCEFMIRSRLRQHAVGQSQTTILGCQ